MIAAQPLNLMVLIGSLGLVLATLAITFRAARPRRLGGRRVQAAAEDVVAGRRRAIGTGLGLAVGLSPGFATAGSRGDDASLALRLQHVEDRLAIQELVSRYAWHVARGEGLEVSALFTEDGGFEGSGRSIHGMPALRKFYSESIKPQMVIPMVQNFIIEVDGDDARGTCKVHSPWSGAGPGWCGWYEDSYRRGPAGWLFVNRKVTMHERPVA